MLRRTLMLATCCLGGVANAADNGFYFGAGAGRSDFDVRNALDNKDTGFKAIAGLRLLDSFGVELNYADHGSASLPSGIACVALVGVNCPSTTYVDATTTSAFAVGFLDFPLLDLFAKAGVSLARGEVRTPGLPSFGFSETDTNFAWGAGAQAHFGSLGARAEYERFKLLDQDLGVISVSLLYTFL
jgi:opacity protein-like surface antigen